MAATIERGEKQILLARHARRLLNLLDDTPVVPGDARPAFDNSAQARQVLNDAEEDLRDWTPSVEPITSSASDVTSNLLPTQSTTGTSEAGELASTVGEGSTTTAAESDTPKTAA